jgi:hypothetical protein
MNRLRQVSHDESLSRIKEVLSGFIRAITTSAAISVDVITREAVAQEVIPCSGRHSGGMVRAR